MARTLTFDAADRVTSVNGAATYTYDYTGKRATKTVGGVTTYFLYDGDRLLYELDAAGHPVYEYHWAADGLRTVQQPYDADGEKQPWPSAFTYDPSGNVVQQLPFWYASPYNSTDTRIYDAYGKLQYFAPAGGSPLPNGVGFGGQYGYYTDADTGLVLCTHRYYDPLRGRWVTRDPIGYAGGMNLYGFCGNNPVMGADPSGYDDDDPNDPLYINESGESPTSRIWKHDVNQLATVSMTGCQFAAEMLPQAGYIEAVTGKNMSGRKMSLFDRMLAGIGLIKVVKYASQARTVARLASLRVDSTVFGNKGFKTFAAFKEVWGSTGKGYAWHHVVEKYQEGKFGVGNIHNAMNIVILSEDAHNAISRIYSMVRPDLTMDTTQSVRQWLSGQSFEEQHAFGRKILNMVINDGLR